MAGTILHCIVALLFRRQAFIWRRVLPSSVRKGELGAAKSKYESETLLILCIILEQGHNEYKSRRTLKRLQNWWCSRMTCFYFVPFHHRKIHLWLISVAAIMNWCWAAATRSVTPASVLRFQHFQFSIKRKAAGVKEKCLNWKSWEIIFMSVMTDSFSSPTTKRNRKITVAF